MIKLIISLFIKCNIFIIGAFSQKVFNFLYLIKILNLKYKDTIKTLIGKMLI